MTNMRKLNQTGSLLLPLVILSLFFLVAAGFGTWAFMSRQDYKNNSDAKAEVAAKKAVAAEDIKKDAAFRETEKFPTKSFTGPDTYGSLTYSFPKTWNSYIGTSNLNLIVNNYYNPDFIPDLSSTAQFALRVQISGTAYPTLLKAYDAVAKAGTSTVTAYRAPKVPSVLGSIITGQIHGTTPGTLVLLPIRDKTIIIWTEGSNYTSDFLNTVLPSITFSP
ncbi:MAG: hypothetical protein JWO47_41 [Candidatus Saccharibacteria bacterium]|nr:hypothetical protein [Candidatus Saccharibacteria bacterium]